MAAHAPYPAYGAVPFVGLISAAPSGKDVVPSVGLISVAPSGKGVARSVGLISVAPSGKGVARSVGLISVSAIRQRCCAVRRPDKRKRHQAKMLRGL
ncbi:hypothetical protein CKO_04197 [Citrobacter koseri ATCC BAA-895]|uniref:Uncharacterized protein n=1 Tax=Citrobacter koseri (strain ATCC BAA-895 / CDC 4225-83 / SGSC4696) TaxID=290338 RepID=A8AP44_CITK8|nr:hypothetical protein CKO_04197 [Citrobacter koseri ATCC BAA-895]